MADGTRGGSNDAALPLIATDDAGAAGQVQIVKLALAADGSATTIDADASGLKVQLGAAVPAGANAIGKLAANSGVDIGDVDVTSLPADPLGANADAIVAAGAAGSISAGIPVTSLPALVAGTANIGDVDIASIAAGDTNIGNVDIVTMPNVTLAAGTNTNDD